MAQVKKFNTGGSVQKMKYGNIIKNGTTYEMTEESMKRLEQYIAAADPDIQQSLANDWQFLMSGQDITIDTMANRRSTVPEDFSKGQLRRLGKDKASESKWHAAVNSDIHKYNLATQYLGKFDPSKSYKIEETPQKDFWKSNKSIEYDVEDDGTKKYRGLSNTDEKNYFNEITAYLMGDDAFRAQYKNPGISNFETLDSWFKSLPNPEEFVKNLWNKIENGQELNSDESQFWDAINMKFGDPKANPKYDEKVENDEDQAAKKKAWETFNVGNVWDDSEMNSDYLVYNPTTGTFTIKMPTLDGSIGYHFNDDFVANNYGYDHLKGKVNFNGVWYNERDLYNPESELYRMLTHKQYDYRNKNLRGDFDAANQILKTNWSGVTYIPASSDYLGPFYDQNSSYIYQDTNWLTNNSKYGALDLGGKNWNLLKAINMNGSANNLGVRDWRYILTDAYGRYIDPYGHVVETPYEFDNSKFSNLYVGQTDPSKQIVNRYTRLTNDSTSPYYNTYADESFTNSDGTPLIEGWVDIGGKNAHMYIDPQLGGIKDTIFSNMPKLIYDILHNESFWQKYDALNDTDKYKFSELINKNVKEDKREKVKENMLKEINWSGLGITDEQLKKAIVDYFVSNRQPINRPESFKKGGVIKCQTPSGPVGEKKVDDKVIQLSKQINSPYESNSFKDELTPTDKLELYAILADLAGAGLGFVPAYGDIANFALSTVGATILGAVADSKRVKQNTLPKGTAWKNAFANIGADALSLAPVAGDVFNLGNTYKRIANVGPKILGLVATLPTVMMYEDIGKAMIKGVTHPGQMTMDEWRKFSMGANILLGLGKTRRDAKKQSKLAAETAKPVEKRYSFNKTDANGKKETKYLEPEDIEALTKAKGQNEIDVAIDNIANKYQLSDSDKAALKLSGPGGMGFQHDKKFIWPNKFNTVKESSTDRDYKYYMWHPNKRAEALSGRTAEDFAKTVKDTERSAHGKRVYGEIKANSKDDEIVLPNGYVVSKGNRKFQKPAVVKVPESATSNTGQSAPNSNVTQSPSSRQNASATSQPNSRQNTSQQTALQSTGHQHDPVYYKQGGILKAQNGLDYLETPYTKKLKQLYDIKLNPNGMITGSVPTGIGIDKPTDPTKPETSLLPIETEIIEFPSMFKKLDNDYHADLMGTKRQATQHAKKFAKDHPGFDHFWWEGKKYGLDGKSYGWGQNPRSGNSSNSWKPTFVDLASSIGRLLFNRNTNDNIVGIKEDGINDAAAASMQSKYDGPALRMPADAGNATRVAARRSIEHLPPVNADYIKYAAQERVGFDLANQLLEKADRETSAGIDAYYDKKFNRDAMVDQINMQIEAKNRQIQGQRMAALSELYASKEAANRQSIDNFLGQLHYDYKKDDQAIRAAEKAKQEVELQYKMRDDYKTALEQDPVVGAKYAEYVAKTKADGKEPLPITNWIVSQPELLPISSEILQDLKKQMDNEIIAASTSHIPAPWLHKSGGKMRSTSDQIAINREKANDQIRVNKYKSFDKNWEDQNKSVRKAIGKMHDRVYNILMKILS